MSKPSKDNLVNRLRGIYAMGPDGEFGDRDFSAFIPPISLEAADRIEELHDALRAILSTEESYGDEQTKLGQIYLKCREVL